MSYIARQAEKSLIEALKSPKVLMILGARQTGKTTLVQHALAGRNALSLNLDVDVDKNRLLAASKLSPHEALASLGSPKILVIDEAQRLPEVSRIVKGWYDVGLPVKIILLGSSSLNLLDQSAESLTGRNEKIFLTPLLFREILTTQVWYSKVFSDEQLQTQFAEQINSGLLQTMIYGSYPEIVTGAGKARLINNLVSDYLLKDILQLGLVKTPELIKKLLTLLAYQIGAEVSVNELASNSGISRVTVERYLDLLEQTFVIFRLPAFSTNPRKEIAKSVKIFFWDIGIRNALLGELSLNPLRPDIGMLWENWAIAELAKQNLQSGQDQRFYFWRSRAGSEVDLIVKKNERLRAFEMKWSGKKGPAKAFTERYQIPVDVIESSHPLVTL